MRLAILAVAAVAALAGRAGAAITPADLNSQERARYEAVKSDPKAADSFLATREYVHKAQAIAAAPLNARLALELKRPKNFDAKFLFAGEVDTINTAVKLSLTALAESMYA